MLLQSRLSLLFLLANASCSVAFQPTIPSLTSSVLGPEKKALPPKGGTSSTGVTMSMSLAVATNTASGALKSVLKKPSKVLTVCLEYDKRAGPGDEASSLTPLELETLSMQLRKLKAGALWTSDLDELSIFAKEQETARGNFPGPCPIVFAGSLDQIVDAIAAGASAVVLDADALGEDGGVDFESEVVWKVSNAKDAERVSNVLGDCVDKACFLVDCDSLEAAMETLEVVPKAAVAIAAVDAMQPEDAEISAARSLKKSGCASILVRGACVGDGEDVEYARFAIEELTSKKSSEFNFSGLTGSANGHFGGVASSEKSKWRRVQAMDT